MNVQPFLYNKSILYERKEIKMKIRTFEVMFNVNGKPGGSIVVQAPNQMTAKRIAMGDLKGQIGYADKKISISAVRDL